MKLKFSMLLPPNLVILREIRELVAIICCDLFTYFENIVTETPNIRQFLCHASCRGLGSFRRRHLRQCWYWYRLALYAYQM